MSQYKSTTVNGLTVTVTNGSAVVTGDGTAFLTEVDIGDIFTVVGHGAWYEVGSVDTDLQITLAANYTGTTDTAALFVLTRDFTPDLGLPYPTKGDIETASLIKRALTMVDSLFGSIADAVFHTLNLGGGEMTHTIGGVAYESILEIHSEGAEHPAGLTVHNHGDSDTLGSNILTLRSKGTHAASTIVTDGTMLGQWYAGGYDGVDYALGGYAGFVINGTPTAGSMPTDFVVALSADGSEAPTEKLRLNYNGDMTVGGNDIMNLRGIDGALSATSTVASCIYIPALHDTDGGKAAKIVGLPAAVMITVAAGVITLWDITGVAPTIFDTYAGPSTAIMAKMLGCSLFVACTGSSGLWSLDYISDQVWQWTTAGLLSRGSVSAGTPATAVLVDASKAIVNDTVNAVAVTTLDTSPIDLTRYGLVKPTIKIGTAAGGSWITDSDVVWDATGAIGIVSTAIGEDGFTCLASASKLYIYDSIPSADIALTSADYTFDTAGTTGPHISGTIDSINLSGNTIRVGTSTGVFVIEYDRTTPANSSVTQVTKDYNTGAQFGDIVGSFFGESDGTSGNLPSTVIDRSVNVNDLTVNGTVPFAEVGARRFVGPFTTANYLSQAYNADWDFGNPQTTDFCIGPILLRHAANSVTEALISRAYDNSGWSGSGLWLYTHSTGDLALQISDDGFATNDSIQSTVPIDDDTPKVVFVGVKDGQLVLWINGVEAASAVTISNCASLDNANATLEIGKRQDNTLPAIIGKVSVLNITKGYFPTDEEIKRETARLLAQCNTTGEITLSGASDSVLAIDYDEQGDNLVVATDVVDTFGSDLIVKSSAASVVGTLQTVSASNNHELTGGSTGSYSKIPSKNLRDEDIEYGNDSSMESFWFLGDTVETEFALPVGWKPKLVFNAGSLEKDGASDDYVVKLNGYVYTISFNVAPAAVDICVTAVRRIS